MKKNIFAVLITMLILTTCALEGDIETLLALSSRGCAAPGSNFNEKLTWIRTNALDEGKYIIELDKNEVIAPITLTFSGKKVTIVLKGVGEIRTISLSSNGAMFTIASGVTLILENKVTLSGLDNNNNSLVIVQADAEFIMNDDTAVRGNSTSRNGSAGGVHVRGTFTMNGGYILDNKWDGNFVYTDFSAGGGVYVDNGIFVMNGGQIHTNSAYCGGGVYIHFLGKFTMKDGLIAANRSELYGGGVYNYGTFIMDGGSISGNTSFERGGGVFTSNDINISSTFTMNDGIISNNRANNTGGGVYVYEARFYMNGGTLSGNYSYGYGGGIYLWKSAFTKTSGTIYGYTPDDSNSNRVQISRDDTSVKSESGHAIYIGGTEIGKDDISEPTDMLVCMYISSTNMTSYSGSWVIYE
ncbi:MAG: hypothetical protein FWD26_02640 [Treponema sp.]|nr:hypothetical protein [Treponema sp.]